MPKTEAPEPPVDGAWASAWVRAAMIGPRFSEATATEALSMMRLMIISFTSSVTATSSAATTAILWASWSSRARFSSER